MPIGTLTRKIQCQPTELGEQAAEQHADAAAAGADEAVDAHGLGAFAGLGEDIHDQGQGGGRDDRAAQALQRRGR